MNAIIRATAVDLAAKIKSRELSSVEVTRAHLQRIEEVDPAVHAFLHIDSERVATPRCASTPRSRTGSRSDRSPVFRSRSRMC